MGGELGLGGGMRSPYYVYFKRESKRSADVNPAHRSHPAHLHPPLCVILTLQVSFVNRVNKSSRINYWWPRWHHFLLSMAPGGEPGYTSLINSSLFSAMTHIWRPYVRSSFLTHPVDIAAFSFYFPCFPCAFSPHISLACSPSQSSESWKAHRLFFLAVSQSPHVHAAIKT